MKAHIQKHLIEKAKELGLSHEEAQDYAQIVHKAQNGKLSMFEAISFTIYEEIMKQALQGQQAVIVVKISSHPKYRV